MREEHLSAVYRECDGPPRERGVARRLHIATDKGDKTMKVIEHYKSAIESSDEHLLKEVFARKSASKSRVEQATVMQRAQHLIF